MIRAALLWLALALPAQADLQAVADALAARPGIPGAAVGVVTPEGSLMAVAGLRSQRSLQPVRPTDRWHLGSLTKAMTATLAARLVERGVIDWTTTIADLLPAPGAHGAVTLRELLTHRSGLPANMPGPLARGAADRAGFVEVALRLPIAGGSRGEFLYSNTGYVVAGAMIEAATGETWEDLIRAEVFAPLGMKDAGFGPPQLNRGHLPGARTVGRRARRADNPAVLGPAGRVHASPSDLAAFLSAHLAWQEGYLTPDSWEYLHTPSEGETYTPGWLVDEAGRLIHSGSNTLWWAVMEVDHATGRALFVAVNAGDQRAARLPVLRAVEDLRAQPSP